MKKTAVLILAATAFAGAAQAADFSANDMNLPLSQLYPGAAKDVAVQSTKSRDEVNAEFQKSRLAGTAAQYSANGGYLLKSSMPGVVPEAKFVSRSRDEVKAEYLASRADHSPAQYSAQENYLMSQAYPGNAVVKSPVSSSSQMAGQASHATLN